MWREQETSKRMGYMSASQLGNTDRNCICVDFTHGLCQLAAVSVFLMCKTNWRPTSRSNDFLTAKHVQVSSLCYDLLTSQWLEDRSVAALEHLIPPPKVLQSRQVPCQ